MDAESSESSPTTSEKPFVITIEEGASEPRYESLVPKHITDQIIAREKIPSQLPPLYSSVVEDFLIGKLSEGLSPEETTELFFTDGVDKRIDGLVGKIDQIRGKIETERVFDLVEAEKVRMNLLNKMKKIGMNSTQLEAIRVLGLGLADGVGVSSLSNTEAYISMGQVIRRGLDYVAVFGEEYPLETVVKAVATNTIAHEIGHKISDLPGLDYNKIPLEWQADGEVRSERFAEFWGRVGLGDNPDFKHILEKETALRVAEAAKVWQFTQDYNSRGEAKFDPVQTLTTISGRLGPNQQNTSALIYARLCGYGVSTMENYASPYSEDQIKLALKT